MSSVALKAPRRAPAEYDTVLTWLVAGLLAVGLVMVYSASITTAEAGKFTGHQATYYLMRHSMFIVVGLIAGVVAFNVPTDTWQKMAMPLFVFGVILLILVLVPGVGKVVNGSRRWLSLLVINLQPSELMKLFAVLYAADYTVRKRNVGQKLIKAFAPMAFVMFVVGALLLQEPDMGAFVVIFAIAFCTLWLGGFNLKVFGLLMVLLPIGFVALVVTSPYRLQRVVGFMNPWSEH